MFDRFFDLSRTNGHGQATIVACSEEAEVVSVAFGYETAFGESTPLWFADGDARYLWHGKSSGAWTKWWVGVEGEYPDVLQKHKWLRVAAMGVIVEFASGKRLPMHISFYLEPVSGKWRLRGAGVSNDYWDDRATPNQPW